MSPLRVFSVFHLNLMFSSVGEERRAEVIERCYRPLIELAEDLGLPLGIEATGVTLELIRDIDPVLLQRMRKLVESGTCEFVGSGFAQVIGPLVPASVNRANLRLGQDRVEALLGVRPTLGFVNEQAWSAGLLAAYQDAGFEGLVMEWNNPARHHPEWPREWRFQSLAVAGTDGRSLPLLWNDSVAFQKVQRVGHGLMDADELVDWWAAFRGPRHQLCVYGGDAEVFDFRPQRFAAEPALERHADEWPRVKALFARVAEDPRFEWARPSDLLSAAGGTQALRLESAAEPCPVKKQPKYNLSRWASSGRDDLAANSACHRIADAFERNGAPDAQWQELCRLWSSDFRTHITEARWRDFQRDLAALESRADRLGVPVADEAPTTSATTSACRVERRGSLLTVEAERLSVVFRLDRGLALEAVTWNEVSDRPLIGRLPHGRFDDIAWSADYYSGHVVFQPPGGAQVTDLSPVEPLVETADDEVQVGATIATPLGEIDKLWRIDPERETLTLTVGFRWREPAKGILRTGHVTLLPEAFDASRLHYATENGGDRETFALDPASQGFDHGATVGPAVSASTALGLTGGWLELGDAERVVRIETSRELAALSGLIRYQPFDGDFFVRASLSAREVDDTAQPVSNDGLVCRTRISARRVPR